ncbi:phage holin family protein [Candidatus Microgenomates bacterium]|nr:phage holin family protein [Candidatus Microgenomates bacterium]
MIRPILRSFVYTGAALGLVALISGNGINFSRGPETFLMASLAISIGNHFVRPILNILLLPINLVTLGLFRWVTNVLMIYAVTIVVAGFQIGAFNSKAVTIQGITIPEIHLAGIAAFLVISFLISFVSSFLYWLAK